MTRLFALAALIALSGCAGGQRIDICKYAEMRRTVYTATIRAADLYALSGRVVPHEIALGRQAAMTALAVLNANCPKVTS